jgi:hypothetical protein
VVKKTTYWLRILMSHFSEIESVNLKKWVFYIDIGKRLAACAIGGSFLSRTFPKLRHQLKIVRAQVPLNFQKFARFLIKKLSGSQNLRGRTQSFFILGYRGLGLNKVKRPSISRAHRGQRLWLQPLTFSTITQNRISSYIECLYIKCWLNISQHLSPLD